MSTNIEWTKNSDGTKGDTWNPISGCSRKSAGCENCYAEVMTKRLAAMGQEKYQGLLSERNKFNGVIKFDEKALLKPLSVKKPTTYFVNSMSDLFHENVKDEWIDKVFAVMALCPQHTFQILTKRPERMRDYFSDKQTPFRITKAKDEIEVQIEIKNSKMELKPIPNYPNYHISNFGIVYSANGSQNCLFCGQIIEGKANQKYCSKKCGQASHFQRSKGNSDKFQQTLVAMSPDIGEDGHQRVMLYVEGVSKRELVHRLVLMVFDRPPHEDEQGCHKTGNPANNHIANLRWGTQSENWQDRKRHGNGLSYSKLTDADIDVIRQSESPDETLAFQYKISSTQIRNIRSFKQWKNESTIEFPLKNVMLGVSVENQKAADERIPLLLETPAAIRFLSCEPLLEEITLWEFDEDSQAMRGCAVIESGGVTVGTPDCPPEGFDDSYVGIDWVIVGGESGNGARPCDIAWIRSLVEQCQAAKVPVFVKQLGANVWMDKSEWSAMSAKDKPLHRKPKENAADFAMRELGTLCKIFTKNKKGGDILEFPEYLQFRELPKI